MSSFWSGWIIVLTVATIIGLFWLLFGNRTRPNTEEKTTGHVYDGIEEYDNPLPAWWLYMFVISMVFAIGYLVLFPGLGNFKGVIGWTQVGQWEKENEKLDAKFDVLLKKYAAMPVEELAKDEKARRSGQRLFASYCATCHGSDAGGNTGFPNLRDQDWLYGGSPDRIAETITEGRKGAMPAWKGIMTDQQINDVATWLAATDPAQKTAAGAQTFATYCAACHGADAKGNLMLGAPNLTDNIWLYGGGIGDIKTTLLYGRNGQMPAHENILTPEKIHLLTAYVYGLSTNPQ
ncbi:MAG: cytochrome-c oxidase, cbb3-type subunit III [Cellvibrionales bacterium]|nr:cytochrome-c oxidase, cbb3-type subunit III [Cellvibrionales bacterium]